MTVIYITGNVSTNIYADRVSEGDVTFSLTKQFTTGNYTHLDLDPTKAFKIICHGWIDSISSIWYRDAKEQYEKRGRANVIDVDWPSHIVSACRCKNCRCQRIQSIVGEKIGRITGLDPARPLFEGNSPDERLSSDDALFVDVMHRDAGTLGYQASIGHVDYYPNGGQKQNGCGSYSHNRASLYFYEGINSDGFLAVACDDFRKGLCKNNQRFIMGENATTTTRGDFYLITAASSPFALG